MARPVCMAAIAGSFALQSLMCTITWYLRKAVGEGDIRIRDLDMC